MTREEIENILRPYNIPSGPTLTVAEAFHSEQLNIRNMIIETEDKTLGKLRMPGIPIKMSEIEDMPTASAPLLGEDTKQYLEEAGINTESIKTLEADNVILCEGGKH